MTLHDLLEQCSVSTLSMFLSQLSLCSGRNICLNEKKIETYSVDDFPHREIGIESHFCHCKRMFRVQNTSIFTNKDFYSIFLKLQLPILSLLDAFFSVNELIYVLY